MSADLEEMITGTLRDRVQEVRDVPGLTDAVRRRARRVRARRRAAAAVACVAVTAGLAGVFISDGDTRRAAPPADRSSSAPSPPQEEALPDEASEAEQAELAERLSRLPVGPPTKLTYAEQRGRIVVAGRTGLSPEQPASVFPVSSTAAGTLAVWHSGGFTGAEDSEAWLVLVREDGSVRRLLQGEQMGASVAPDGRTLAAAYDPQPYGGPSTIAIIDVASGARTHTTQVDNVVRVVDWSGKRAVLMDFGPRYSDAPDDRSVWSWVPGERPERIAAGGASAASSSYLVLERPNGTDPCARLVRFQRPLEPLMMQCVAYSQTAISPDERFVVSQAFAVVDLRSGARRTPAWPLVGGFRLIGWEGDAIVGAITHGSDDVLETTLVRCRASKGTCERVPTPPGLVERTITLK